MGTQPPILQRISPKTSDEFSKAFAYYELMSAINHLYLTEREIQLIAFMVIKGNMLTLPVKEEFCTRFDSTIATIGNMVTRLKKKNVLIKEKNKIRVNPQIVLDFSRIIVLQIKLDSSYES